MSLFNNSLKGNIVLGLAIGIGALLVAPAAVRLLRDIMKPAAEGVVKGGACLYDRGKELATGAWDSVSKMMSEVQSEITARRAPAAAAAGTAAARGPKPARVRTRAPRKTVARKKAVVKPDTTET